MIIYALNPLSSQWEMVKFCSTIQGRRQLGRTTGRTNAITKSTRATTTRQPSWIHWVSTAFVCRLDSQKYFSMSNPRPWPWSRPDLQR